jgi:outer membrane protein OmpA-like peptidoglycan-associated protein
MRPLRRLATGLALSALLTSSAWAQGNQSPQTPTTDSETRPATTTVYGDTGLWFVPTGEVLPRGRWSVSGYRTNWDREESAMDVSNFRVTFGYGATDRVELFGNIDLQRRIDADTRPVRINGTPMNDPLTYQPWATGLGDVRLGAKVNLLAPWRQQPAAFAIRGALKLPTSDTDEGLGTGKLDAFADVIVSGEAARSVELSGYVGLYHRGDPDDYDLSGGLRWGVGAGFPSRGPFRVTTELVGERYFDNEITYSGADLVTPRRWDVASPADLVIGFTYQATNGFFLGWGASIGLNTTNRADLGVPFTREKTFDRWGNQVRLGWHPGARVYVAPPPPPPPPPPAPENRPPTVKARCEPCVVEIGKTSTVTADAQDPDGDTLTYKWSAPNGTFANPAERQTIFTCANTPGSVPVSVSVSDGKGGTASDTVTIQCVEPKRPEWKFEDVHFDFDRYNLRPEALRILDEAVKAMQADNTLRLTIEGHTDSIGTNEYNLALGERRANAAREYLVSRGIAADRFNIVSYGEERPKHDNTREETRRLNRRAALIVRLTQ